MCQVFIMVFVLHFNTFLSYYKTSIGKRRRFK
jgi:hypothetical protein